jgi:hypothetical protein
LAAVALARHLLLLLLGLLAGVLSHCCHSQRCYPHHWSWDHLQRHLLQEQAQHG